MKNCGNCEHCKVVKVNPNIVTVIPYCAHPEGMERVVPHSGQLSEDYESYTINFWRTPVECPVYEGSETKCHPRDQTALTLRVADIPARNAP